MAYVPTSKLIELAKRNLDGATWYDLAAIEIACIVENHNSRFPHAASGRWNVERLTSILALTSPRVAVRRNVRLALTYMATGQFLHPTMRGIRRSVEVWEETGEIHGPKVSAFRDALLGDDNAIVLDVHMANLFRVDQSLLSRRHIRNGLEATIRDVASAIGLSPRNTQACLWFGRKRSIGENPEAFPIRQEYANWLAHNGTFGCGPIRCYADRSGFFQQSLALGE